MTRRSRCSAKCLQLDPEDHAACNYLGYMWAEKGVHLEEALSLIQRAVKLDPKNGAYIDSLGWVLFKLGRNEEALVQLRHAVELIKDDATWCADISRNVLMKLGKNGGSAHRVCAVPVSGAGQQRDSRKTPKELKRDQSASTSTAGGKPGFPAPVESLSPL